jgi:hypothetical protein
MVCNCIPIWYHHANSETFIYTPERSADAYIERTINERRALLSMAIEDGNTTTWRMPVSGEDVRGVWAERYYQATPR